MRYGCSMFLVHQGRLLQNIQGTSQTGKHSKVQTSEKKSEFYFAVFIAVIIFGTPQNSAENVRVFLGCY